MFDLKRSPAEEERTAGAHMIEQMAGDMPGVIYTVPWAVIGLVAAIAYVASLLTTFLPARQASKIYPAEALRYE